MGMCFYPQPEKRFLIFVYFFSSWIVVPHLFSVYIIYFSTFLSIALLHLTKNNTLPQNIFGERLGTTRDIERREHSLIRYWNVILNSLPQLTVCLHFPTPTYPSKSQQENTDMCKITPETSVLRQYNVVQLNVQTETGNTVFIKTMNHHSGLIYASSLQLFFSFFVQV